MRIIYFFARIDQQAEIFHSSLSKQDSTKETNKNTNNNKNTKTQKRKDKKTDIS